MRKRAILQESAKCFGVNFKDESRPVECFSSSGSNAFPEDGSIEAGDGPCVLLFAVFVGKIVRDPLRRVLDSDTSSTVGRGKSIVKDVETNFMWKSR